MFVSGDGDRWGFGGDARLGTALIRKDSWLNAEHLLWQLRGVWAHMHVPLGKCTSAGMLTATCCCVVHPQGDAGRVVGARSAHICTTTCTLTTWQLLVCVSHAVRLTHHAHATVGTAGA